MNIPGQFQGESERASVVFYLLSKPKLKSTQPPPAAGQSYPAIVLEQRQQHLSSQTIRPGFLALGKTNRIELSLNPEPLYGLPSCRTAKITSKRNGTASRSLRSLPRS